MYYEIVQQYKRPIITAIAVVFFVIVAVFTVTSIDHIGKSPVYVSTVPSDATVKFNSTNRGNGTQWMPAGTYTVTVQKDGFETVKRTVIVDDKKSQNVVAVSLIAVSSEAKKWADDHATDYRKNEAYGAIEASVNGDYFTQRNPITTKLPYVDPYFTLGYVSHDNQTISLTIETPSPRYRYFAIEKLRQMGYDPTDFDIVFKDFKNPLEIKMGDK